MCRGGINCTRAVLLGSIFIHALSAPASFGQTNTYWRALEIDPAIYRSPYRISLFNPQNGEDGERAWSQTKSVFVYGMGVVGVLMLLPPEMTGWDPDSDVWGKWADNVSSGPVWDRDNWAYNYIGHTYSGGVYYQVARKSGYRQWDAFIYTFLMSTFYWEYGIEAIAERPSIQDLAVTPLLGWVYGEWAYQTEIGIRDQDNEVMGSRVLGAFSLFWLDPVDSIGRGLNRLTRRKLVRAGYGYFSYAPATTATESGHTLYLNVEIPIGGPAEPDPERRVHYEDVNDPVDTGMVGISFGPGFTHLDEVWGIKNGTYNKVTLGLYFTPCFSSRVAYARGRLESADDGRSLIYENYSLDAQYYLRSRRKLRPYLTAGFGEQQWDEELETRTSQLNAGLGVHWQLDSKWAIEVDWINYFTHNRSVHDHQINAGVVYRFGEGERQTW